MYNKDETLKNEKEILPEDEACSCADAEVVEDGDLNWERPVPGTPDQVAEPPEGTQAESEAQSGEASDAPLDETGQEGPSGPEQEEAAWRQEKQELVSLLQRKQADFENFRRISRVQQEEAREYGLFDFTGKLIPILDNLERAVQSACRENVPGSYVEGLEMIYKQLLQEMEKEGVTVIEALGKPFDPHYHHAVIQTEEEAGEPGTVVEELQKGYLFRKRVLRPSMVKVIKG